LNEQKTILGPPGCGKTQTNSNLIHKYIKQGIDPDKIACVSFTKKAATESRERVCKNWNLTEEDLPYFQTLHSMAFQVLGHKPTEVMQSSDIRKIGYEVGLDFNSSTSDVENDFDFIGYKKGDAYLNIYQLSRSKKIPVEDVFQQTGDYNLDYSELTRLIGAYNSYKKAHNKIDFTDMIEQFIREETIPNIEVLIVDEAQDLSTLQWTMIDVLRTVPSIQIFTGDDDQAIMNFQGADVKAFLTATEKKEVLHQSYRVPPPIFDEAQTIVNKIEGRAPKKWKPKDAPGTVNFHWNLEDVPINEGEWTILGRTNRILDRYAMELRNEGWIYNRHGHPSIPKKHYEGILAWESLCKGEEITIQQARNIYTLMKVGEGFKRGYGPRSRPLLDLAGEALVNMDYLRKDLGLLVDGEKRWHQVLGKIGLDMQHYILNALKRGDNVKNPRIKLSTIHSIKGGEDDNILLIPDISYAAYKEYERNPSIEHRVFYVGVTRAKKNLHIMQPQTERFYNI
jgi:superfamily I DNA/RNA helicase